MTCPKNASVIAILWDNFGPMHADRCDAVAEALGAQRPVIGIELFGRSDVYAWEPDAGTRFRKVTLLRDRNWNDASIWSIIWRTLLLCRREKVAHLFLCHYEHPPIFWTAMIARAMGIRVYAMGCSKFDDKERVLWREVLKSLYYLPYRGGIGSGQRSRDYLRFLGLRKARVSAEYNTLSISRIRRLAGLPPAPGGLPHADRHFTIVARFVPKKNLVFALRAYAAYRELSSAPRPLHLCGSGPQETQLRALVDELGLKNVVEFRGFLQSDGIARVLGSSLALLLPSLEEQFGNVVIEALAMGLPVILSDNCGARDRLIRSGVNGFVVEPDSIEGWAYFMDILCRDLDKWRQMAIASLERAPMGDAAKFAEAVIELTGSRSAKAAARGSVADFKHV